MDCYVGERVWVVPGWGGRAQSPMLGYLFRSGLRNVASHLGGGERVYGAPVSPPRLQLGKQSRGRAVRSPRGAGAEQDKARADLGGAVARSSGVHAECPIPA